jgi:hypothetical protein
VHGRSRSLSLRFDASCGSTLRARIGYAAAVFAAIYGWRVEDPGGSGVDVRLLYGPAGALCHPGEFHLVQRYQPRPSSSAAPCPMRAEHHGQEFHLFHGADRSTGNPDWLGEIFEWLSAADEWGITTRDPVGRIPYAATVFARYGLSPLVAYAARLMSWLQEGITGGPRLPQPPSPRPGSGHAVVVTHDIDFYGLLRRSVPMRLVKNAGNALLRRRDAAYLRGTAMELLSFAGGRRVGDFIPGLLECASRLGFASTFFVIGDHRHRRDANYEVSQLAPRLHEILASGSSVSLHGSYTSIVENRSLRTEAAALETAAGTRPLGNRQHWLRFGEHPSLFAAIEAVPFEYDSTLGFAEVAGFRNGACFAFPPYDFSREGPCAFLEIPLALMDVSLPSGPEADDVARAILTESRRWGWGGMSVVWHNPMEPLHASSVVNDVFWRMLDEGLQQGDAWISAEEFLGSCLSRYHDAGLLRAINPNLQA